MLTSSPRQAAPIPRAPARAPRHGSTPTGGVRVGEGKAARRAVCGRRLQCLAFKSSNEHSAKADSKGSHATVSFQACRHLEYGQVLKVVGGPEQLGAWDLAKAPAMSWSEGDQWLLTLELPAGRHEFKLVVVQGRQPADWERGPNRTLQVPEAQAAIPNAFKVNCEWGSSAATLETMLHEEAQDSGSPALSPGEHLGTATESDEPALRAEDLTAEPYSPAGDEEEKPGSTVGNMTVEGRLRQESAGTAQGAAAPPAESPPIKVPASSPEPLGGSAASTPVGPAAAMGKQDSKAGCRPAASDSMAFSPDGGAVAVPVEEPGIKAGPSTTQQPKSGGETSGPGGGSGNADSIASSADPHAAVSLEAGDYPSQTPMGQGSDVALGGEPAGGLKPSTEAAVKRELQQAALTGSFEEDKDDEGGSSGGSTPGGGDGGSSGAGGSGSSNANPQNSSSEEKGRGSEEPPAGMQFVLSAVGLAALPVVAYSEWVLKSTGCGLPPGPNGLLGAAEGLSYLVVGGLVAWSLARKIKTGSGLPAGPAGMLGAVEGGSWVAAASGLVVLALQWQRYGYIPSALPDSNCFGEEAASSSFAAAQAPSRMVPLLNAAGQRTAPVLAAMDGNKAGQASYGSTLRLTVGSPGALPQGNLLFSLETALSQSGSIFEAAETAAAAVTAVAAGQPPPEQVAAAVQQLQQRAQQAQQLASALSGRVVALGGREGTERALAAAAATAVVEQPAAPGPEPLNFEPPRHKLRAALASTWVSLTKNEKVRALLEPYPLPAVARRQEAVAAARASELTAMLAAGEQALEAARVGEAGALEPQSQTAAQVLQSMQQRVQRLHGMAERVGGRVAAVLPPELRQWVPTARTQQETTPRTAQVTTAPAAAATPATAAAPTNAAPVSPGKLRAASTAAGSGAKEGKAAGLDKPAAAHLSSAGMFVQAVSDLREGFAGLWQSAVDFDPQQAAAVLRERLHHQEPPSSSKPMQKAGTAEAPTE